MHRLDDMHVDHIDFAHIDVQGAEAMVLDGGESTFKTTKAIWMEVAEVELYEHLVKRTAIISRMENFYGFKVMKDTCTGKRFGDILFVR